MPGGKGKSIGGKGGKGDAAGKAQKSHSAKAGLQVRLILAPSVTGGRDNVSGGKWACDAGTERLDGFTFDASGSPSLLLKRGGLGHSRSSSHAPSLPTA